MRVLWMLVALSACVQPRAIECDGGRVCPPDTACDEVHQLCVSPEQLDSCRGLLDGTECPIAGVAGGVCSSEVCLHAGCGDAFVTGSEQCDLNNLGGVDDCTDLGYYEPGPVGCDVGCRYDVTACHRICGDGVLDRGDGEECDRNELGAFSDCRDIGYYDSGPLRCNSLCLYDRTACTGFCGDGMINGAEICDGGAPAGGCLDFGFDAGRLACAAGVCAPDFAKCARLGWHLVASPATSDIYGIWGNAPANVWAVAGATMMRFNGASWTTMPSAPSEPYLALWGVGSDVWASSASGNVVRYNGTSFTTTSIGGTLRGLSGTSVTDVWVVGGFNGGSRIAHYDGSAWSLVTLTPAGTDLYGVWAIAADDVWAVGVGGAIYHRTVTGWASVPSPTTQALSSVWATSPSDVWAVGASGAIVHYDGSSWSSYSPSPTSGALTTIYGTGPKDVWAFGVEGSFHYDGVVWQRAGSPTPIALRSGWARAPGDVWTGGAQGTLAHYADAGWTQQTLMTTLSIHAISSTGAVPTSVWVVGNAGTVLRFDGARWQSVTSPAATVNLFAVSAYGESDVWVGGTGSGGGSAYHWNGTAWTAYASLMPTGVASIAGPSSTDLWAVGGTSAVRYSGAWGTLETVPISTTLSSVWASGPNDVWAVGSVRALVHRNATSWSVVTVPSTVDAGVNLNGVWGSAANDVWVVGGKGTVLHFDGSVWKHVDAAITLDLEAVDGTGPNDVWSVGAGGLVLHYDGVGWTQVRSSATGQRLEGLAVTGRHISTIANPTFIDHLDRVRPWPSTCASAETCNDAVDNNCDGKIDAQDTTCP